MTPAVSVTGTDATAPPIRVEDVSVSYGDVSVLEGLSLSVAAGELVGLVGPNGAGKTTLLRTINGVLEPDGGSVTIAGRDVHDLPSRAASRLVATVPQTATVAFDFPVEDVVAMGRTPYHGRFSRDPDAGEAVERALERTETARFRDRPVDSLSGGERQRVVLARALAQETPALLLDEPTSNLDINHQVRTLELVRDLVDTEGTAALAAIHDLDLAARFCDRLALLTEGTILSVGSPEEVLRDGPLADAFGTDSAVLPNPVTGTPTVTPVTDTDARPEVCHVVGTGHGAARAIAELVRTGFTVTAGPLPTDGVAAATARELAARTVTAPPFSPVDGETEAAVRDSIDAADAVVLAGSVPPSLRDSVAACSVVIETGETGERAGGPVDGQPAGSYPTVGRDRSAHADGGTDEPPSLDEPRSLADRVRRAVGRPAGTGQR